MKTDGRRDGAKTDGSCLEVAAPWNRLVFEMMGPLRVGVGATYGLAPFRLRNFFPKKLPVRDIRHYPEPLDIDLSVFRRMVEAEKQINSARNVKDKEKEWLIDSTEDAGWRMSTVDTFYELQFLREYVCWAETGPKRQAIGRNWSSSQNS